MLIGIDVDGVICDFTNSARALCKKLFNGRPDDKLVQTEWDFECLGITPAEEGMMWHIIDTTPNWWLNLKRLPNTTNLEPLAHIHDVIFITNRKPATGMTITQQTKYWLDQNTDIVAPTVIVTKNKGQLCKLLDVDYFIDDKWENCMDVAIQSPKTAVFVKDELYNRRESVHGSILNRVSTFDDFAAKILWRSQADGFAE